ncbi:MAG: glycosyltransferase family 4 protein [Acidimicrobiia bacterium]|nr:glycosyltransferase family 4 protein [Acidimicrobiia bacterium]
MSGPAVLLCATGFPRAVDDDHKPFLLDHARALVAAGCSVTVLCPSAPGLPAREQIGGIDVVRFRYAPRRAETLAYDGAMYRRVAGLHGLLVPIFVVAFTLAAARLARQGRVDVVHGHWWAPTGLVAVAAARVSGAASVVHLHGSDAAISRGPIARLAGWVLRRVDLVMAVSDELADWCRSVSGVTAVVAPMPLPAVHLPSVTADAPADGPVLAVGRLVPEKGFDVLVRAVGVTGQRLVLVGDGPEHRALKALAVEVGADVELVGPLPPAAVADLYRRARLVAVPSRREGFGMVAAEAAAHGRTVVGTRVGGIPSLVDHGETGLLVDPDDVAGLAHALEAADPSMGRQAAAGVASLHPEAHARVLLAGYESALRARADRACRAGRRRRRP